MSPRPGGEADKVGNRYEAAWTVRHLLYVLQGTSQSIKVEDSGPLADGVEFTYSHDGVVEVHQVKRQNRNANTWSIKSLQDRDVWRNARAHADAGRHYHFVSMLPARPLQELTERVRSSDDLDHFIKDDLPKKLGELFSELSELEVIGSPTEAWRVLHSFWIEWHDERELAKTNAVLAELLLECPAGKLASTGLADIVSNSLGLTLDAAEIERRLPAYGMRRVDPAKTVRLSDQVTSVTSAWTMSVERELLRPTIDRTEATQLVSLIMDDDRLVLLTGNAGGGKSAVLHQAVCALEADATPVLGFRLDRLEPFSSTTELGSRVGLDASPVAALAAVADGQPSVLIIDQLDAVSLASGRMPRNFDAVASLVQEASAFPTMRIVLACRKFDVDNDYRIRELVNDENCARVEVGELSDSQVVEQVSAMGLDSNILDSRQMELLRTPLNLVLLKSVASSPDALAFQTAKHLFDKFWDRKFADSKQRRDSVRFNKVISTLAGAISSRQRLSVPITVYDAEDLAADAGVLVSEHVLVRDGQQVAFFHESFFDYSFARGWVGSGQNLVEFLTSGEQELFRRAQVRQIMNHLRELEPHRFVAEIQSVLTSADTRYHIKDVVLALLGALSEPTTAEWQMVAETLGTSPSFENRLWWSLRTVDWFTRLDDEGVIEEWLAGDDETLQSHALEIMSGVAKAHPDRLVELIRPYTRRAFYLAWLRWVARFADVQHCRPLFDLILAAVRNGQYEGAEHELWLSVHDLGEQKPAWAVELLAAYLIDRPGALELDASDRVKALLDREHNAVELARQGAAGEPQLFCDHFLPYMLRVMSLTEYSPGTERPIPDHHFSHRQPGGQASELEDVILAGVASAIRIRAEQNPTAVRPVLETLAADPHDAAQWLLYEGLRSAGQIFAEWAASILTEGTYRFLSGYSSNSVWTSRQLIQATSLFMSEQSFAAVEAAILKVRFSWETRRPGWYMFNLLSAMNERRLSDVGRRRLGELRRAAGTDQPSEPTGVRGGFIGSPIPSSATQYMNDDQWLSAMAKHSTEKTDWDKFTGGAHELSQLLKQEVVKDPTRFARLAMRITANTHPAYADMILIGLGEAEALDDPSVVFDAIRHIAGLGQEPNDRWLGQAARKYLKVVPSDIIDIVADRAANSKDPMPGDGSRLQRQGGREHRGGEELYTAGLNTARGAAAQVLGDMLIYDTDGSRTAQILPLLSKMAEDPVVSVRAFVAHVIHACMRHARTQALAAFKRLIDADDLLLATHSVGRLIAHIGYGEPAIVTPVIQTMLDSAVFETREVGGQLATVAAIGWNVPDMLASVLGGADLASRRGAALACAQSLSSPSDRLIASNALTQFVNDHDEEVRKAAAGLVVGLRGERLRPFSELLLALMSSAAFVVALPQLLITLERAVDRIDDLVLECARRFVEAFGAEAADIRTGAAGEAREVGELLIRAYAQATLPVSRSKILDLLDQLLEIGAYGVADMVAESER